MGDNQSKAFLQLSWNEHSESFFTVLLPYFCKFNNNFDATLNIRRNEFTLKTNVRFVSAVKFHYRVNLCSIYVSSAFLFIFNCLFQ